jgi:hypothetical protein
MRFFVALLFIFIWNLETNAQLIERMSPKTVATHIYNATTEKYDISGKADGGKLEVYLTEKTLMVIGQEVVEYTIVSEVKRDTSRDLFKTREFMATTSRGNSVVIYWVSGLVIKVQLEHILIEYWAIEV